MKRVLLAALAGLAVLAAPAHAKEGDLLVDAHLDVALEPADGFGTAIGPRFGAAVDLGRHELWARADLAYYGWSRDHQGVDLSYRRIPVTGSLRKYFTVPDSPVKPFAQAGLELSFDRVEARVLNTAVGDSRVRVGLVLAGGAELPLNDKVSASAALQYHLEDDGYPVFGLGGVYRF